MTDDLSIFLDGTYVGEMTQSRQGAVTFRYDDEYRTASAATPLSLSMPLAVKEHRSRVAKAFIAGLLPDSQSRLDELARQYRVSAANPFALLRHIGRDAAGAVQMLPPGERSTDAAERQGVVRELDDEAFDALITDVVQNAATWGRRDGGIRWSLPGAQPKVALFRSEDGKWAIPEDATPTTHILKPAVPPYEHHHVNEFMTMEAARLLGLNAAQDELATTASGKKVFISKRYDRAKRDGRWTRLHQEDLCQALGIQPDRKYQEDGGPSIGDIGQLFKRFPEIQDRADAARRFFEAIVFNVTALGTDAHAKNYSLLLSGDRVALAPLYDLGTHGPYPVDGGRPLKVAMSVDGEYRIDAISEVMLERAGLRIGIPVEESREIVERVRAGIVGAFAQAAEIAEQIMDDESGFARKVADSIAQHARARGWQSA